MFVDGYPEAWVNDPIFRIGLFFLFRRCCVILDFSILYPKEVTMSFSLFYIPHLKLVSCNTVVFVFFFSTAQRFVAIHRPLDHLPNSKPYLANG